MSGFRSYCPDLAGTKERVALTTFESHHLVTTNRARNGDVVVAFNGLGLEWDTLLEKDDRKEAILVRKQTRAHPKPSRQVILAIALVKGKTFDLILRQATELGVIGIQPIETKRTQIHLKNPEAKVEKWKAQLVEACKQSGNPWLPTIREPVPLSDFLNDSSGNSSIVASLEDTTTPWNELRLSESVTLFVGPEGDFSNTEYDYLRKKGVQAVSLGSNVLRTETAVTTALSRVFLMELKNAG
tara:strand:- start:6450 stop:7175 length:726 start_codon:yes stop_codon:yes gene_type:complete